MPGRSLSSAPCRFVNNVLPRRRIGESAPLAALAIRAFSSDPAAGRVKKCDKTRL
jgi:hypothetical protein